MSRKTDDARFQRLKPLRENRWLLMVVGLALTLAAATLMVFKPTALRMAELRLYDLMLAGRLAPPQSHVPVLVGIDEESLAAYGQWPWPRYRLARLVENLEQRGAEVVVLDFLMPEPDRTSPDVIQAERQRDRMNGVKPQEASFNDSNSQLLAAALSKGKTVIGYYLDFSEKTPLGPQQNPITIPPGTVLTASPESTRGWPKPSGIIRSLPLLSRAASAEGFTNATQDSDGTLRRSPLMLLAPDGSLMPSLALSALLLSSADHTLRLVKDTSEMSLSWGKRKIPLDDNGNMLLDFREKTKPFPYQSAHEILSTPPVPNSLTGKIVLVGAWAKGLGDAHPVPSGRIMEGLEVHATVIDDILADSVIARPHWARGAEMTALLLLGISSTLLLSRSGFWLSLIPIVAGTIGCYWVARQLLVSWGLYLSPLLPMVTAVLITAFLGLLKYGIEAKKVRQRTKELMEAQDEVIMSLSVLSEARDKETGAHILRTRRYVEILAHQLATTPKYAYLDDGIIELIGKSAPLHDIGKVGIPDSILQKPGKLTDAEYAVMKTHTLIGEEALSRIVSSSDPEKNDFLHFAQEMAASHHEKWDGTGYPRGLKGDDIPLAGRLMAIADVYDALISRRVYKSSFSREDVQKFIVQHSGTHFDPDVVDAFMARNEDFYMVAQQYPDKIEIESEENAESFLSHHVFPYAH
jgi:CHASE2 domain-containing sensor protein